MADELLSQNRVMKVYLEFKTLRIPSRHLFVLTAQSLLPLAPHPHSQCSRSLSPTLVTSLIYRTRSFMKRAPPEGLLMLNAPANTEFYF